MQACKAACAAAAIASYGAWRHLVAKLGNCRDQFDTTGFGTHTWSNRQIWPWSTDWSRAKANRVLPRENTGHSKHSLPRTQQKTLHMDITRRSTPKSDWLYSLQPKTEKLYTVSKIRPGADCGSDHELLIAKFRLKLKKVGKTTGPFRYDLNQIPYDYIVEMRNRFTGLNLIECLMNYGWRFMTLYRRQEKEMQKSKMAVWGGLTNSCEKRSEEKGEKERCKHLNAEFQRIARRDKKASSAINAKK